MQTMRVKAWGNGQGAFVTINASDFDSEIHAALDAAAEPAAEPDAESSAAIPADWQGMAWPKLRRLAASVSDTPILNRTDADAAIRAALAKG